MRRLEDRAKQRLRENQVPAGRLTPKATALILSLTDLWEKPQGRRAKPKLVDKEWFCRTVLSALERLDKVEEELNRREKQ